MAITTIDFDITANDDVTQVVEYRQNWGDAWNDISTTFFAMSIKWRTNPEMPTASILYRHGAGQTPGTDAFTTYSPTPAVTRGDYIRITVTGHEIISGDASSKTKEWYGVVKKVDDQDNGRIIFSCEGMESLLTDFDIDSTVVVDDHDADDANWTFERIEQSIVFNSENVGNRTSEKIDSSKYYAFSQYELFTTENSWSTTDIVEYLLQTMTPVDDSDVKRVPFELDDSNNLLPFWDSPEIDPKGQKTKTLLDSLVSRARGIGYYLVVESDVIKAKIFTYASQKVEFDIDGTTRSVEQNPDRYILKTSNLLQGSQHVQINNETRYDAIRCVGARAIYCFSLSVTDETLVERWKPSLKTKYDQAASTLAGYPAATEVEARQRADQVARANPKFENVYSRFGVSVKDPDAVDFWDGVVYGGEYGGAGSPAIPKPDDAAAPQTLYPKEIRFLSTLPLRKNYEYKGTADPPVIKSDLDDLTGEFYRDPLIVFKRPDLVDKWIDGTKIQQLANLEVLDDADEQKAEYDWSVSFQPEPNEPMFKITVSGQPQHIIAPVDALNFGPGFQSSIFSPLYYERNYIKSKWSYSEMIVTVAMHGNDYCEATTESLKPLSDIVRTKRINVGERFQKHHVAADTVVAVDETGALERREVSGVIRDDFEQVAAIAAFAYVWYSLDRATLAVNTGHFGNFQLGYMVASMVDGKAVTFDTVTDLMTVTDNPFSNGEAVVFFLDDAATLPKPLTPGQIYYVVDKAGNNNKLAYRPDDSAINLTEAGAGNAFVTNNGVNTPITAIDLDLPVSGGDRTGPATMQIQTGASEFDVRQFI